MQLGGAGRAVLFNGVERRTHGLTGVESSGRKGDKGRGTFALWSRSPTSKVDFNRRDGTREGDRAWVLREM